MGHISRCGLQNLCGLADIGCGTLHPKYADCPGICLSLTRLCGKSEKHQDHGTTGEAHQTGAVRLLESSISSLRIDSAPPASRLSSEDVESPNTWRATNLGRR